MKLNGSNMIRAVLLIGILLVNVNCDSATNDSDVMSAESSDLLAEMSQELALTSTQVTSFEQTLARHDRGERPVGFLWYVADSLSNILTDEQIDKLIDRTRTLEGGNHFRGLAGFVGGGPYYGFGRFRGIGAKGRAAADSVLNLTDDQKDQIKDIHKSYRDQAKSLIDSFRDGTITADDLVRGLLELRTDRKTDVTAVLTADQLAALDEFKLQREARIEALAAEVKAVRDAVLGLDVATSGAYDSINLEQLDAREVLVDEFEAGDIDLATLQQEIAELIGVRSEALEALLSADQFVVVTIHDALVVRVAKRGHRSRRHADRPGNN